MKQSLALCLLLFSVEVVCSSAQELPYFVTYSQHMEEPGNLDIEFFSVVGSPPGANSFLGFEHRIRIWRENLVDF